MAKKQSRVFPHPLSIDESRSQDFAYKTHNHTDKLIRKHSLRTSILSVQDTDGVKDAEKGHGAVQKLKF